MPDSNMGSRVSHQRHTNAFSPSLAPPRRTRVALRPISPATTLRSCPDPSTLTLNNPRLKLQNVITRAAHKVKKHNFLQSFNLADPTVSESDFIRANSRANPAIILHANLSDKLSFMTQTQFVSVARTQLMLPQIPHVGNLQDSPWPYQAEVCLNVHKGSVGEKAFLDLAGNHANSGCPASSHALHHRHKLIIRCVYYLGQEAGLEIDLEPATSNVLCGQYSPVECRHLFPKKHLSKVRQAELDILHDNLLQLKALCPGPVKDERILANLNQQAVIIGTQDGEVTVGLRLDIRLYDPVSGREVFIDVTGISATCASKRTKELKQTIARLRSQMQSALDGIQNLRKQEVSAAVRAAVLAKITKYSRLVAIARSQKDHKLRPSYPEFRAVVISTLGEFGIDTVEVQEFLLACYKRKLEREGDRADGLSTQQLTARFRSRLRIGMQVAMAKGCADMATRAGLPSSKNRRAAIDPHRFARPKQGKPVYSQNRGNKPKSSININQKGSKPPFISSHARTPNTPKTKVSWRRGSPVLRSPPRPRTFGDFLKV